MISKVLMPKLGLVMKKGRIIRWYKNTGDHVKEGEPLFQISTEKVTIDVEAKASGYLRFVYAQPGSIVPVSGIVGLIGDRDDPLPDIKPPVYEIDRSAIKQTQEVSESHYEEQGDEVISPKQGIASRRQGATRNDKSPIDKLQEIKASPAAKKLAKEKGIDLSMVRGTGPGGRITESDVTNYEPQEVKQQPATPYARKIAGQYGVAIEQVARSAGDRKIYAQDVIDFSASVPSADMASTLLPLSDMRRAVAERMSYSAHTSAPVTLGMEVVAEELIKLKDDMGRKYPSDKVTINDILVKIVAMALRKHPLANASLDDKGIRLYNSINIGIGVAVEGGLIVPAVADADKKNIVRISRESKELIEKARTGKLTLEELSRGTFTVTNLGAYGIDMFTPIINPPQSATLGIGRIVQKPWVMEDRIGIVSTMILSLTFDHRIIDGAPAAQFLFTIKQYIENPHMLPGEKYGL